MASVDPWGQNLRPEIEAMLDREEMEFIMRVPFLRENYLRGKEEGINDLLRTLFAHRVGRRPTRGEERKMANRVHALGPDQVGKVILDLEGDALLRWLAQPSRR